MFTKRNPRYNVDKPYDWTKPQPPRDFVIEERTKISKSLASDCFAVITHAPRWTTWRLVTHCNSGLIIEGKSTAVWMMEKYKRVCKSYDDVRLLFRGKMIKHKCVGTP